MSDVINFPGWLTSAARAACGYGYRELAEAAGVSTAWLQKVERLSVISPRPEKGGPGAHGVDEVPLLRLLAEFRRHGLELRAAGAGWPAALVCNDPAALDKVRAANGKGAGDAVE